MSIAITLHGAPDGDDGPFTVASNSEWARAAKWADALDPELYPHVITLFADGEVMRTNALSIQLRNALNAAPPESAAVRAVLEDLLECVGVGDPEETASTSDA